MSREPKGLSLQDVLSKPYVKNVVENTCGPHPIVVEHPHCYVLTAEKEDPRDVKRIILLPPVFGCTGESRNEANYFGNTERATIEVKGTIREDAGKGQPPIQGFGRPNNALLVVGFDDPEYVSPGNETGRRYQIGRTVSDIKTYNSGARVEMYDSAAPPFTVVRPDGFGIHHNLINASTDWLLLVVDKKWRAQRDINLETHLKDVDDQQAEVLREFQRSLIKNGSEVFKVSQDVVRAVGALPLTVSLPALTEILGMRETAKKEPCGVFGMLMQVGRRDPEAAIDFFTRALENEAAPPHHLKNLIKKLEKSLEQKSIPHGEWSEQLLGSLAQNDADNHTPVVRDGLGFDYS